MTYSIWKEYKLGDICQVVGGGTPSKKMKEFYEGGEIPWITPKDLSNYKSRYINKGATNINELGLEKSSAKLMPKGTVLFSSRAPIGYVAIAGQQVSTNQGFKSFICNDKFINNIYLYYWLKSNVKRIESLASGTTFKEISGAVAKNITIKLPPLHIQQDIVKILGILDEKIELNNKMNQTLDNMAMALYKHWFVDFGPFKEEEFVDSKVGRIPKGWKVTSLGDYCSYITDGAHASPKEKKGSNRFIVTVKDMQDYSFNFNSLKPISKEDFERLVKGNCQPEKEDVLLSKDGTMGKVLYMWEKPENIVTLSSIAIFRTSYSPIYLYLFLRNPENMKMIINGYSSGSALNRLVLKNLKLVKLVFPPEEILHEFERCAKTLIDKIGQNEKEIIILEQTRDYLLPKLLSGEIDLPEAKEKVEEVVQ